MAARAKNGQKIFPCWCFTWSSFPADAPQGLLSLLTLHWVFFPCWRSESLFSLLTLHRVFFPCWRSTGSSFPADAPQGLLSLLTLHRVFFLCYCFTWAYFSADAPQISYFKVLPWQSNKLAPSPPPPHPPWAQVSDPRLVFFFFFHSWKYDLTLLIPYMKCQALFSEKIKEISLILPYANFD